MYIYGLLQKISEQDSLSFEVFDLLEKEYKLMTIN
jgi:hypothetical protein